MSERFSPQRVRRGLWWVSVLLLVTGVSCTGATAQNLPQMPEIIFEPDVVSKMRYIFSVGQLRGNHPDVFSKVGDSITVSPNFLQPIGWGAYDLGDYAHLQPIVDYYLTTVPAAGNAFAHRSLAAGVGWAAWGALDPSLADETACFAGEMPLRCEYRLMKPSVALIMYGTNDLHYRTPAQFRADLERIITISIESGVIPVLSTIPPQPDAASTVMQFNDIVRELAADESLPLWDYHAALSPLPDEGLAWDRLHPSSPTDDYQQSAIFTPRHLRYGYVVRNLTALMMLNAVYHAVQAPWFNK